MLMAAPDSNVFKTPMSYGARDTLAKLLDWSSKYVALYGNNPRAMMADFIKAYSQLRYEEAQQAYDVEAYVKVVVPAQGVKSRPGLKPKTQEELMSILSLEKLFDQQWSSTHGINKKNRVGDISQCGELYSWLINNFVTGDFPISDLNNIAHMGRMCDIDIIKREARNIAELDKHTVPYLFAVVRGVTSRDEIKKARGGMADDANNKKLIAIFTSAIEGQNKTIHTFDPDTTEKWKMEREFVELARKLSEE